MTEAQEKLYWRLWGQVRKVQPGADRHALHRAPSAEWPQGLPESHTTWGKRAELDEWKARCLAIARPADFGAQHAQAGMEATRHRVFIGHLLRALRKPEGYAEKMVARMLKNDRARWSGAGSALTLETLDAVRLRHVVYELKEQCRRVWPKKKDMLEAIYRVREEEDFDESAALDRVKRALHRESLGRGLEAMVYEDLLVVLSALRALLEEPF